jgi:hypothetical protein
VANKLFKPDFPTTGKPDDWQKYLAPKAFGKIDSGAFGSWLMVR